jgi:hypothetical protein
MARGAFCSRYYAGQEGDRVRNSVKKKKSRLELKDEDNLLFD